MKNAKRSGSVWASAAVAFALVAWVSIRPTHAEAQTPGNNAIFDSGGHCSPCDSSTALVDASVFGGALKNICGVLYGIFSAAGYPSAGEVIDARGLPFTTPPTSMTCPTGTTPWNNGTTYLSNVNSTILLPAGTIGIPGTWVLPSNTRLIGEGDGIPPSSGAFPGTRIQLVSGNTVSSMIQFGSSSSCSGGISVERLTLDGQAQAIDGIVNQYCPGPSSVDHVTLFQILGTGLSVSANANDSGPYANIRFDTGGYSGTSSTACAQIKSNRTSSVRRPA
jgi:hypothetical protein